jgi:hypothetical protein
MKHWIIWFRSAGRVAFAALLQEFSWRYNRRHLQPDMFQDLLREVTSKAPLTYKELTQRTF